MNKEEILEKSRNENEGKKDERENAAYGEASKVETLTGEFICLILVLIGKYINVPKVAFTALIVYFAMVGSSRISLYKQLKEKSFLVRGIISIIMAIAFSVAFIFV